ncbi:hypothetical protein DICPUDRAFT_85390 [Dictyostelium purpureum]|uniref:Uncharacterized protein n=1 Tax=Dictyostelium purpureum TaxID=5786 RepID=F1A5K6_DICPU|nr:uncharacterized protein DICPUDRAFT_85390 [Dictyostelium purpureum]EGC28529.1 hypothetical protein DICPUDRAFT_85390 [Dictyostelium purpureum]|eukprot:XP_003294950.1 hypothetical protein DICPUDRAFT_85390 [Dictyostelium purpureum]
MIIKEKKSKLNLKYIWLIKIKPGFNRTVISFFHSINQCFKDQHQKIKEKKNRKKDKDIDREFRHNTKHNMNDPMVENNDFTDRSIFNKHQDNAYKKSHTHHHHHPHETKQDYFEKDINTNENINIPYVKGEIATDKKYFDNTNYLEELSSLEKKYNIELKNGNLSNETSFEYAKKLSHSQNKENRRKSIDLFLELLKNDKENQERYLLELGTTYYKQEDYNNANVYIDKVLQSSPLNRQALSLKYLVGPVNPPPIQVNS